MKTKQNRPCIETQSFYAAEKYNNFYRVQVIKMSKGGNQAYCFFIDLGTKEWLDTSTLYNCENEFLVIPSQAICLRLVGLECFVECPFAKKWMDTYLIGDGTLTARILSNKKDNFSTTKGNAFRNYAAISAILYDDSGPESNLNGVILMKICSSLREPKLLPNDLILVKITHTTKNGEIYCQNAESKAGLKIIADALQEHRSANLNLENVFEAPPASTELADFRKTYLVIHPDSQAIFRAIIRQDPDLTLTNLASIPCFFIDYGFTKKVQYNRIFRSTVLLENYPKQAIAVRLHGVQDMNADTLLHLRSLLKPDDSVYLEVIQKESDASPHLPLVRIYKLTETSNYMSSINDLLQTNTIHSVVQYPTEK